MATDGDPLPGLAGTALLLVASYGRAGSSRLMEVLRITGAATVLGPFPFENRSVQFGALCATGAGTVAADGAVTFDGFEYRPPSTRTPDESENDYRERILTEYAYLIPYADAAAITDDADGAALFVATGPPTTSLLAEKSAGLGVVAHLLQALPTARCVVLDRDPRDVFVSVLGFNERRGFVSFGAEDGPRRLAERIAEYYLGAGALVAAWGGRAAVVDYGQLLARPLDVVARLAPTWSPPDRTAPLRKDLSAVAHPDHVTASSTGASVGRWRTERSRYPEEFALLAEAHRRFRRFTSR